MDLSSFTRISADFISSIVISSSREGTYEAPVTRTTQSSLFPLHLSLQNERLNLRAQVFQAKRFKKKLFLIAIDFDGAFDRVSRAVLVRKLCLFGAGTVFTTCLASIYMNTDNVIFRDGSHVMYKLYSGIKQGLPLSPYIFLFYIDDIFDFMGLSDPSGPNFHMREWWPMVLNHNRNRLDHFQPNQMTQIGLGVQKVSESKRSQKKKFEKFYCFFLIRIAKKNRKKKLKNF